ncbi:manganese catalase family protein [Eubacterium sp. MSJ-21]|nr:manganese catalase family protein [Eubacterium sp. MSJ-21]
MWIYEKRLQCPVNIKETNAKLAQAIISQYGGPDGEMGASMRYLSQRYAMPYKECQAVLTDIGTEELGHLEIVASIIYQLTKNLSMEEIKASGFDKYYIDHTIGIWPQAAGGVPFNACEFQSKGDTITDLYEDLAAEQKARSTYDNILRLCKDYPDVYEPIKFLRAREIVHFQRFGEALRLVQDKLDEKNFYAFNPAFDRSAPCIDQKKCNCGK